MAGEAVTGLPQGVGQTCPGPQVGQVGQQPYKGLSLSRCPGGVPWYVVRSATNREFTAEASLVEVLQGTGQGVYLPRLQRWRRIYRLKEKVERPLLTGYLFAQLREQDIHPALEAFGVHALLRRWGSDGQPRPVPVAPDLVAVLQDQEAHGWFDETIAKGSRILVTERVRIIQGMFQGYVGTVSKVGEGDRMLTVDLLKMGPMLIDTAAVERVEE